MYECRRAVGGRAPYLKKAGSQREQYLPALLAWLRQSRLLFDVHVRGDKALSAATLWVKARGFQVLSASGLRGRCGLWRLSRAFVDRRGGRRRDSATIAGEGDDAAGGAEPFARSL